MVERHEAGQRKLTSTEAEGCRLQRLALFLHRRVGSVIGRDHLELTRLQRRKKCRGIG
jgi:hypothetical protein